MLDIRYKLHTKPIKRADGPEIKELADLFEKIDAFGYVKLLAIKLLSKEIEMSVSVGALAN